MVFKPQHVTWSHTLTWQLSVSLLFPPERSFCLCWREASERHYDCSGLASHCRLPWRHRAETWEDKEYRNYRHDAGSCSAETGHCAANSVGRYNGFPFSFLVPVWVLFFCFSFFLWQNDVWYPINLAPCLCVCCFLRGLQRIELLTPWTWTRSRKDSKQPCRSFNHR